MRLALVWLCGVSMSCAETCVPAGIVPGSQVSGTLDASSCLLSDGSAYTSYRLVLPVRGQVQINLTSSNANLSLILQDSTGAQVAGGTAVQQPVEAGTYTILVNGQTAGQLGAFAFETGFTAEPGMWCTAFGPMGLNQTFAGTLGASGCNLPGGAPYEAYLLDTFGPGTLSLTVSNAGFTSVVMVRDDNGLLVASGQGAVSVAVMADSQYEIVVTTADTAGAYQLAGAFQPAANQACAPQQSFTAPGQDTNAITGASCATVIDSAGDLAYYNYYTLTLANAGLADISVASTDFSPTIYLMDAGGNQLAVVQSELRIQLPAGSYTVQLFSDVPSGGNYSLAYAFTAGAPQPCAVTPATAGQAISGAISSASCLTLIGLADIYSITLASAGTLSAALSAPGFTSQVAIRDAKDNLIALNEDAEGVGFSSVGALLPAGAYTVVAAAASGSGAYQLTAGFQAQPVPPCTQATQVPVNTAYIQLLGTSGCINAGGQPMDLYQFTMPADGVAAAIMTSSGIAGRLILTGANGNFLRADTTSYSSNDPMIVQFLPAGTYQLSAQGASSGAAGLYQLTVLAIAGPRPPFCAPTGTLAPGASVSGSLTFTGCQYVDGTFANLYQVTLSGAANVTLLLQSSDFNAYLVLLDTNGNVLAQDNDSGGGTDAEITQPLDAGTYYVVAKPFANYYSTGAYTLSLEAQ